MNGDTSQVMSMARRARAEALRQWLAAAVAGLMALLGGRPFAGKRLRAIRSDR
jgi:hypothetical protein